MRTSRVFIIAAIAGLVLAGVVVAQPFGPGMMGGYGPGYGMMGGSGPGYGMMGGYGPGWMMGGGYGPGGMMGGGYGGGYGPGMMGGYGPGAYGGQANLNLTTDNVKTYLERMLAIQGNPHLKLGEVKEKDADTIIADIVTKDKDALVQRFAVDRHTGFYRPQEN